MAPVLVQSASPSGEPVAYLNRLVTIVGSKPNSHVRLPSPEVSGSHAMFVTLGERTYVRDLASRTGVFVGGRAIQEALLRDGDRIRIGDFEFEFRVVASPPGDVGAREVAPAGAVDPSQPREPLELVVQGYDDAPPVPVEGPIFVIGRREGAELILDDKNISSAHTAIIQVGERWHLYDLNSRYGTFVNDTPTRSAALSDGDLIRLGDFRLQCQRAGGGAGSPAPPAAGPALKAVQQSPAPRPHPAPAQAPSPPRAAPAASEVASAPAASPGPQPKSGAPPSSVHPGKTPTRPPPVTPVPKEQATAATREPGVTARTKAATGSRARPSTDRDAAAYVPSHEHSDRPAAEAPAETEKASRPVAATHASGSTAAAHVLPEGDAAPVKAPVPMAATANTVAPEPAPPVATTLAEPAEQSASSASQFARSPIEQCRRCGYYLKSTSLSCPGCGKWRRRAYALLAAGLLLLALIALLVTVGLPRLKLTTPGRRAESALALDPPREPVIQPRRGPRRPAGEIFLHTRTVVISSGLQMCRCTAPLCRSVDASTRRAAPGASGGSGDDVH
jgi:pSer/pThr/pTyr-binding forkhead associated (FHA) protein